MQNENSEIHSQVVKAGKRTYFFDIKTTKSQDFYLTITESKKITVDGKESFQKHKLFLYKEDFEKFQETLNGVLEKANELNGNSNELDNAGNSYATEVTFDDL
jgi:hypothetical protein